MIDEQVFQWALTCCLKKKQKEVGRIWVSPEWKICIIAEPLWEKRAIVCLYWCTDWDCRVACAYRVIYKCHKLKRNFVISYFDILLNMNKKVIEIPNMYYFNWWHHLWITPKPTQLTQQVTVHFYGTVSCPFLPTRCGFLRPPHSSSPTLSTTQYTY